MSSAKQRWFLLYAVTLAAFTSTLCASLHSTFYPQQAEKRGASATEYGLVFGIYELVSFLSCAVFGKYMGRVGAGCLLQGGILLGGVSTISFGLLYLTDNYYWFMSLSYILRVAESLGSAAIITASLALVVMIFSDSFARAFSVVQVFQGLAYMLAPTIGGGLFEFGGFWCPFAVVGASILFSGVLVFFGLLNVEHTEGQDKPLPSIWPVLKIPQVFLDTCSMTVQATSVGFIITTLEPHLRNFHLSPSSIGALFIINSIVFSLASPIVGVLCDKQFSTTKMIITGCSANICGILLIGPMAYIPVDTSLWMVGVGMGCIGLGTSLTHVPAVVDALSSAVKHGLPCDIATYALIAGLSEAMSSLGATIGPSVAGILFDAVGFRRSSLFIVAVNALMIASFIWSARAEKRYARIQGLNCATTPINKYINGAPAASLMLGSKADRSTLDARADDKRACLLKETQSVAMSDP